MEGLLVSKLKKHFIIIILFLFQTLSADWSLFRSNQDHLNGFRKNRSVLATSANPALSGKTFYIGYSVRIKKISLAVLGSETCNLLDN